MTFNLRYYQQEAKDAIFQKWDNGTKNTLLVLPTGCGKTVVFAQITKELIAKQKKILIIAHRTELLTQAQNKLAAYGVMTAMEKGKETSIGTDANAVLASIQTISRKNRLSKFDTEFFDYIIIDEAHHAAAASYQKVLNYFKHAKVLGVTATPERGDKKTLADTFENIAYEYPLDKAIDEKFLTPIEACLLPVKIDISNCKISKGDFDADSIHTALDPYLEQIAKKMESYCKNRKTVVFLPLIATAKKFMQILNRHGFRACEVNHESKNRAELLKDFEDDKYNVICNTMLLTEGWDCPSVDCVICLRPTKICSLYQQMVGRGTRPYANKKNLLILDFLWLSGQHDLCKPSCLIKQPEQAADVDAYMTYNTKPVNIFSKIDKTTIIEKENTLAQTLSSHSHRKTKMINPLTYIQMLNPYYNWNTYNDEKPTPKQIALLAKFDIDASYIPSKKDASHIIAILMNRREAKLASAKQMTLLQKFGFTNIKKCTSNTARLVIDNIAKNNWHVPNNMNIHACLI